MPLWWVLGVDQGIWLVVAGSLGFYALIRRDVPTRFAVAVSLFVCVAVLSGLLSAEGTRWLTLIRDVLIIAAFFSAVIGTRAMVRDSVPFRFFALATIVFLTLSALASIVAVIFQRSFEFSTVIAPWVPDVIARTDLGAASLTERQLATPSFLLGLQFWRPQGLFLYSTSQAVAQAVVLPLILAMTLRLPRLRNWLIIAAVINLASLIATTTRAPVLALCIAAVAVWLARRWVIGYVRIDIPVNARTLGVTAITVLLLSAGVFAAGAGDQVLDFFASRSGETRSNLYEATISQWQERPVLGWGTEVDLIPTPTPVPTTSESPGNPSPTPVPSPTIAPVPLTPQQMPPLGSHSQYLGILFKQGLIGIAVFLAILTVLLRAASEAFRTKSADLIIVAFLASLLAGLTEELWLDPATAVVIAVVWGSILAYAAPAGSALLKGRGRP
jgi:O-antigen ligase